MVTIDDIGNGTGYLYCTDLDAVLQSADKNNADGIRNMHNLGIGAAPLAANKSAIGAITINSCASAGSITSVTVDGNELLAGNYDITTNNVTTEAQGLAAAINANTPVTGYKYFAYNVLGVCYLQAPQSAGTLANGLVVDAAVSIGSINYSTTDMSGGTDSTGLTDDISGRRFFMDSDPLATATDLSDRCIEITKYIIVRGLQSGFISKTVDIENDSLGFMDRASAVQTIYLNPESGNSDALVHIAPEGFVDGDIVILKTFDDANTITVEDYNNSSSPYLKNIFLSSGIPYALSLRTLAIILQYQYSPIYGGIFTELNRSSGTPLLVDILLADLLQLISNDKLVRGLKYKITRPDFDEQLVVYATSLNTVSSYAQSSDYPLDEIKYNVDSDTIYYRKDHVKNLSAPYDWRTRKSNLTVTKFSFSESLPFTPTSIDINAVTYPIDALDEVVNSADVAQCVLNMLTRVSGFGIAYSNDTGFSIDIIIIHAEADSIDNLVINGNTYSPTSSGAYEFYTFGNNIDMELDDYTIAADGNGGNCANISLETSGLAVFGDNCSDIIQKGSSDRLLISNYCSDIRLDDSSFCCPTTCSNINLKNCTIQIATVGLTQLYDYQDNCMIPIGVAIKKSSNSERFLRTSSFASEVNPLDIKVKFFEQSSSIDNFIIVDDLNIDTLNTSLQSAGNGISVGAKGYRLIPIKGKVLTITKTDPITATGQFNFDLIVDGELSQYVDINYVSDGTYTWWVLISTNV